MKKLLLLLSMVGGISLSAQNIVTSLPQYKSAVLEEFTGIHCVFCPDGHKLAKQLKASNPGRVLLVNIHEGGYAVPSGSEPDFRTPWGTALRQQTGLQGYPAGTINRHVFPEFNSQTALSRGSWAAAAEQIMQEVSPAAIGAATSYDASTRQLTIDLEVLYSSNAANSYNLINIALLQDSILGPQTGGSTYNPGDMMNGQYVHAHMLRDFITGQWGDTIPNTTAGSLFTKTYTYTLPQDVNGVPVVPEHTHLAIYITENRQEITQGITIGIDGDSNDGNNAPYYGDFSSSTSIMEGTNATPVTFNTDLNLTADGDFEFELITDAPSDWSASYTINGTSYTGTNTINLTTANNNTAQVIVTAGATSALANYTLVARPVGVSNSEMRQELYLISGITDLIVNSTGNSGNGQLYNWEPKYEGGLIAASNTTYDATDAEIMRAGIDAGAFSNVKNLYFNAGWTFPPITDDQIDALTSFLDNGGNLFIAGQDLGWAFNTSRTQGGYQTPTSINFYTNYLHADYVADGNLTNNKLTPIGTDNIFGGISASNTVRPYGSNFYPDEIDTLNGSKAIFNYNNSDEIAGIRYYNGVYKIVYLGIGLEMIEDPVVSNAIIQTSYNWFNGYVSVEEFDNGMKNISTYPNPVKDVLNITIEEDGFYDIELYDIRGALVKKSSKELQSGDFKLDMSALPKGLYSISLNCNGKSFTKKIEKR